jgi:hypothetical protein
MNRVTVLAPTSPERLEGELDSQPSAWRRLALIGAVFQRAPLRWWFANHSGPRSKSDLSKVPIYPGT